MKNQITKEVKEQILARVRKGKQTVVEIAAQHGVKVNTVYGWISRGLGNGGSPLLEISRLKRENASLKQIIGNLVLTLERGKKDEHDQKCHH